MRDQALPDPPSIQVQLQLGKGLQSTTLSTLSPALEGGMRKWKGISPSTSRESLNGTHGPCKSSRSCTLKIIICFIHFDCACSRSRDQTCVSLQADSLPVSQQRSPRFMHSRMEWASPFKRICKESLNKLQMNGWPICLPRTLGWLDHNFKK